MSAGDRLFQSAWSFCQDQQAVSQADGLRSNCSLCGNHAQGVAYAAMIKKIACTIVMPENASPAKVAATRSYGAKIIRRGTNYDDAWEATQQIAKSEGA